MIKKDNVNYRAFEGDFKPVNVFAKDNKVAGYVSESAEGQELELSNTYNDSYEDLKVFGKSEQKAQWNQAEGVTSQNGEPSPESPVDLISNIPAGSYQIPTENGIYEVTLTEDLRGLDDTYRDKICFDSLSGKGYRENNTQLVRITRSNMNPYRNTSDVTYRLQGAAVLRDTIPKTIPNAPVFCNRLKRYRLTSELVANDIVGISNYTESGMAYNNVYIFLSKSDIGITADDTDDTMKAKAYDYLDTTPFYVVVHAGKTKVPLTFTKVESSTLPVLQSDSMADISPSPDYPHQIYGLSNVTLQSRGRNLFDKEWINNIADSSANNKYHCTEGVYDVRYPVYYDYLPCITANYPTIKPGNYTIAFDCMIPSNTQNKKTAAVGLRKPPSGDYFSMPEGRSVVLSSNDVWQKVVKSFTVAEETEYALNIQPISISDYSVTVCFKNIQIAEDTYTADTMPPYDRYRNTSATVPIALKSCGEDNDYLVSDGQTVKRYQYIRDLVIDGTLNNFVCNVVGSTGDPRCQFYVKNNLLSYDSLKQGSVVKTSHGFSTQVKAEGTNYLPYLIFPWEVLGLTAVPTVAEANEAAKNYCAAQNALGTPLTLSYVLNTPVITSITDTWAQDLLALKTAPYYTKLYADKETGGLSAKYKHF